MGDILKHIENLKKKFDDQKKNMHMPADAFPEIEILNQPYVPQISLLLAGVASWIFYWARNILVCEKQQEISYR